MKHRSTVFSLNSIGIMLGVFIAAAAVSPAWSEETSAGAASDTDTTTAIAAPASEAEIAPAVIQHAEDAAATAEHNAENSVVAPAEEHADAHATEGAMPAEAGGEHHGESLGFPQLDPSTYASQVFWLFVSFIILFVLMSKVALPRVGNVLEFRQSIKKDNLDQAEQLQGEATGIKAAYEASLAKAHEAANDSLKASEQSIASKVSAENAKFADHARTRIISAEQSIAKAKDEALASLSDISAEIAADMVNKIAGTQLTKADAKKAVAAAQKG